MYQRLTTIIKAIIGLACITAAGLTLLAADLRFYERAPLEKAVAPPNPSVFVIRPGDGFGVVARRLADAGLVRSPIRFRLLGRIDDRDKQIKPGEYHLSPAQSPGEIITKFIQGDVILHRLTVPEGYNLAQIAHLAANAGLVDEKRFVRLAHDAGFIRSLEIEALSLEGYLFPETYYFPRSANSQAIIRAMVRRFNGVFTPAWRDAASKLGFTPHEILTLASIIEKETGVSRERALISSVFHNRLRKKMRLESDPTVIYGIRDFDGNLTRKHLKTPGPYNTYLNAGLPPGPIASPGADAIKAALLPENTRYLFFVSKKDGTHHFTTHYAAHRRAVVKYQLNR